jgi:anti-anti-sigma factor
MADIAGLVLESKSFPGVADAALLRLSGKGGHGAVRRLQETIQPLLAEGKKKLLFDCARLEFFNSIAFGYLINLSDSLRGAGGTIAFCRVPKKVQVAFDSLSLGDYFGFFSDESQAALSWKKSEPKPAPLPKSQVPREKAASEKSAQPLPSSIKFALPAWLDEVDKPGPPPLDHLRWSALLQTVLRRLGPEALEGIPRRANVPAGSPASLVARAILRGLQSPEELLNLFEEKALRSLCRLYGLSEDGGKESLIATLISFVQQSTTESLARFMEETPATPPPVAGRSTIEATNENVLRALEGCPLPKLLKSERSARELLLKHLAKIFGKEKVAANRAVGRHLTTRVEIDVAERFGILVRPGKSLRGKTSKDSKKIEELLGQVVLLAGIYGRGNLFVVLFGEIPKEEAGALGEARALMEHVGGRSIQLH